MANKLTREEVNKLLAVWEAPKGEGLAFWHSVLEQLAYTMQINEELKYLWYPIQDYLRENPEIIGAKLGDSFSRRLLDFLKQQKETSNV